MGVEGLSLWSWTLRVTLVPLAAWAVNRFLHRRSAALRHLVWSLALAVLVLLPVAQNLPAVQLAWLGAGGSSWTTAHRVGGGDSALADPDLQGLRRASAATTVVPQRPRFLVRLLLGAYGAVTAGLLLYLLLGRARLAWIARRGRPVPEILRPMGPKAQALGLAARVTHLLDETRTRLGVSTAERSAALLLSLVILFAAGSTRRVRGAAPGDGTPLIEAVRGGDVAIVDSLLSHGAESPLVQAVSNGDEEMPGLLLEAGADPAKAVSDDDRPLVIAAQRGDRRLLELLLEHSPNEAGRPRR